MISRAIRVLTPTPRIKCRSTQILNSFGRRHLSTPATETIKTISVDNTPKKVIIDPSQYGTRPLPTDPTEPLLGELRSYKVFLQEGQKVLWCSCGHSKTPPFCDGTHKTLPNPFQPVLYEAKETKLYGFCLCRYSKSPICDGTHKLFQGWTKPVVKPVQNNPAPPVFDPSLI